MWKALSVNEVRDEQPIQQRFPIHLGSQRNEVDIHLHLWTILPSCIFLIRICIHFSNGGLSWPRLTCSCHFAASSSAQRGITSVLPLWRNTSIRINSDDSDNYTQTPTWRTVTDRAAHSAGKHINAHMVPWIALWIAIKLHSWGGSAVPAGIVALIWTFLGERAIEWSLINELHW